jgi:hypothetical protein
MVVSNMDQMLDDLETRFLEYRATHPNIVGLWVAYLERTRRSLQTFKLNTEIALRAIQNSGCDIDMAGVAMLYALASTPAPPPSREPEESLDID